MSFLTKNNIYTSIIARIVVSVLAFRIAYPVFSAWFAIFFALVPLLQIEYYSYSAKIKKRYSFLWVWLAFALINVSTLYWAFEDTPVGFVILCVCNGFCMALPIGLFGLWHKKWANWVGESRAYLFFVALWIAVEYARFYGDFAFPWLTLGNCFATIPSIIQWYAFTGVLGGSLWIVLCNVWLFLFFQKIVLLQAKYITISAILFGFPVGISWLLLQKNNLPTATHQTLIMHPAMQRYGSHAINPHLQTDKYIKQIESNIKPTTQLIILPETAVQVKNWKHLLDRHLPTQYFKKILNKYPKTTLLSGIITCEYTPQELEAEKEVGTNRFYKTYNDMIQINVTDKIQMRSKEKLVPYEERRPYYLRWFDDVYFYWGGENWHYTRPTYTQKDLFSVPKSSYNLLPLICYESVFYEFATQKLDNHTAFITCSANEIWYHKTEGAEQAFLLCKILAICAGKSVARSSDFGISALIDKNGYTLQKTSKATPDCLEAQVPVYEGITFYAMYGDLIGKASIFVSILLILLSFYLKTKEI